jgi:cytoskeletal protein CcmA (bactofilin family)
MLKLRGFAAEDLNGFLDEGTEVNGELRFRDALRVDGRIKGRIVSDNTLIIGESGQVEAASGSSCSPAAGWRRRSSPPSS